MNQPEPTPKTSNMPIDHKSQNFSSPLYTFTKAALYKHLADKYYLPPRDSKGVTRLYLERVEKGTCFRIELIEMKRFLAELSPSQTKRSLHTNKAEAFIKLVTILRELGLKPLSFDADYVPDSEWLFNVMRYVDGSNVSGVFECELKSSPKLEYDSALLLKLKKTAEQVEFVDTGFLKDKHNFDAVKKLIEHQRRLMGRKAEAQMMMRDLEVRNSSIKKDEQEIKSELTRIIWGARARRETSAEIGEEELPELKAKVEV